MSSPSLPTPYYDHEGITIYCGDAQDIVPRLEDRSIDCVFTDPPYGHNNNDGDMIANWERAFGRDSTGCEARPIANDGPEANDLVKWVFGEFNRLLDGGGCCCVCCAGGGGPNPQFARWSLWLDEMVGFKQAVVWDKGPMGMGWHYRRSYEMVLVGEKKGGKCRWFDTTSKIENVVRHIPKMIPSKDDHPTQKPVELAKHFIQIHTTRDQLVLDPFAGGGSTLEAAKQLGRRAIGVELDERWCEMAVARLAQGVLAL
jgi:DNA modification methylase